MSPPELAGCLEERFGERLKRDVPLGRLTTYRIGGPAALYLEPGSRSDLEAVARCLQTAGEGVPIITLGRGSNLVISDKGWPGLVLRLAPRAFSFTRPGDDPDSLVAGAATSLPVVANWAARRGLSGLEFMIAIPGSIGGAVRMNAGAHGSETSGALATATVLDLSSGELTERKAPELELSYRQSNLTEEEVVLDATFELVPQTEDEVRARLESFRKHRAETQPPAVQNAGSTFKNPAGDHAGRLVEAAGLKGFRVGGVEVSRLHANFFVSDETATAQDVYDLVHEVARRVKEDCGIELEPEVKFTGEFEDRSHT